MSELNGIVVIDKPPGMTSHDVVARVRRGLNVKRVGHGGTLDPEATGVLVIGVGRATRLLSFAQSAPKRYIASGRLGITTSTLDAVGERIEEREVAVDRAALEQVVGDFVGDVEQVPPMVSAVKVGGERLYKKALRGEEIERAARRVTIYDLTVVSFNSPDFVLDVACSAGTYVRTLVHDIGRVLDCGAHLTSLKRTEAGGFTEAQAIALDDVTGDKVRPALEVVSHLPRVEVSSESERDVTHGRGLPRDLAPVAEGENVAVVDSGGRLLAVYRRAGDALLPERVLVS